MNSFGNSCEIKHYNCKNKLQNIGYEDIRFSRKKYK